MDLKLNFRKCLLKKMENFIEISKVRLIINENFDALTRQLKCLENVVSVCQNTRNVSIEILSI